MAPVPTGSSITTGITVVKISGLRYLQPEIIQTQYRLQQGKCALERTGRQRNRYARPLRFIGEPLGTLYLERLHRDYCAQRKRNRRVEFGKFFSEEKQYHDPRNFGFVIWRRLNG